MSRTYFEEVKRDDGTGIVVEYSFRNLSAALAEASIVCAFIETPEPEDAHTVKLTDAERDRIEAWLVEHHEDYD